MRSGPSAKEMQTLLAALPQPGDEQPTLLPDGEPVHTVYVYPTDQGGLLLSPTPLEEDEDEDPPPPHPVIDSVPPPPREPRRDLPHFFSFLFLLCFFVLFDVADSQLVALMGPTATITITPRVRTVTLQSSAPLGTWLAPIMVSESQTVPTTGHGHQDARTAGGTLTFYNGSNTASRINAGTVFTGNDGMRVATVAAVTIPAAVAPQFGAATVPAQAQAVGARGDIPADDINLAVSSDLTVKNLTAFTGGQDARDFKIVTQADTQTVAASMKAKVAASMTAALEGQLLPGEQLHPMPCHPRVSADHDIGQEAATLQVTVADSCAAIVYDTKQLDDQAIRLLRTLATKAIGQGYRLFGTVNVTVTKTTMTTKTGVLLSFTVQGTYLYQLTARAQQQIKTLAAGKPRRDALHLIEVLPGIQTVTIVGIPNNTVLPMDTTHIHLLLLIEG